VFVDKVARGAKPADVPVEEAIKFETSFNMRAANISIPTSMPLRANRVIE
jgi:putative tryptophan/tyrosine transport system substrate-binding protein